MIKILMVEDDDTLASIIQRYLHSKNIYLDNTPTATKLLERLNDNSISYDLLILDLTLPDIDGLDLIDNIRAITDIPIIISSARDDIVDKIKGFEKGADDYLPKPYDPIELELRIKTVLNRYNQTKKSKDIFVIDNDTHTISFKGEKLDLTQAQYDILQLLINRKNGIVTREDMIYNSINIDDDSSLKNIDVLISYIRKKIKNIDDSKNYIQSVRGMGYKLVI